MQSKSSISINPQPPQHCHKKFNWKLSPLHGLSIPKHFYWKTNSFADDNSSLKAKFFLASFPNSSSSTLFEKSLLIIEYIQILHPILTFALFSQPSHNSFFSQAVLLFVRLINPARWIAFEQIHAFRLIVFIIVAAFSFLKLDMPRIRDVSQQWIESKLR